MGISLLEFLYSLFNNNKNLLLKLFQIYFVIINRCFSITWLSLTGVRITSGGLGDLGVPPTLLDVIKDSRLPPLSLPPRPRWTREVYVQKCLYFKFYLRMGHKNKKVIRSNSGLLVLKNYSLLLFSLEIRCALY